MIDKTKQYYSLTKDNGDEICIEPLLFNRWYIATYDKDQLLLAPKVEIEEEILDSLLRSVEEKNNKKFIIKNV